MPKQHFEKLVPDTSIIIEGLLSLKIEKKEFTVDDLIIHEATYAELEHQANQGRATGLLGLDELKKLQKIATVRISGRRPLPQEIAYAKKGEIDALIRQLAYEEDATLITADRVQAHVAEAKSMKVFFVQKEIVRKILKLDQYFDETTMSVHLREGVTPKAKRGKPGDWEFIEVSKKKLDVEDVKDISREILEEASSRKDGFIEIERPGSTVVQLGRYRIVITRPPFSNGWEITAVKPVKMLAMEDYKLGEKLKNRIAGQAEGILIAGSPGQGKSTFAQALIGEFVKLNKNIKTVEAPRDLVVPEEVTQLAISRGTPEEVRDVLLLSRPDYTIFDEMRNIKDFELYADLRLAGVGMVGVVHGTTAMDALQRFIGKIELGVIPHVVDTLVFIKNGGIGNVLSVKMEVKVPSGMTEADLARPVVVVNEFETGKAIAEIYTYGEEAVVVPVTESKPTGMRALAAESIEHALQKYSQHVKAEVVSDNKAVVYVPERYIASIIGKEGKVIQAIEKELGIGIDIREMTSMPNEPAQAKKVPFDVSTSGKYVEFVLGNHMSGKDIDLHINGQFIAAFNVGNKGVVSIKKSNPLGKACMNAIHFKEKIEFLA